MKYYIDAGANRGEFVKKFKKEVFNWQEYSIICFEPNPLLSNYFDNDVILYKKAIYVENMFRPFYTGKDDQSSTLDGSKKILPPLIEIVECIDFNKYLDDLIRENDFVVLKMDIEGTEFDIVPKLIKTNVISKIDVFTLDLHPNKLNRDVTKELNLILEYFYNKPSYVFHGRIRGRRYKHVINFKELIDENNRNTRYSR